MSPHSRPLDATQHLRTELASALGELDRLQYNGVRRARSEAHTAGLSEATS